MKRGLFMIVVAVACATSEAERARQASDRRARRDSVITTDVVKTLQTPSLVGRLIYERPADLSYDSLRVKRPDLVPDRPER